jgi:hypothetical protein
MGICVTVGKALGEVGKEERTGEETGFTGADGGKGGCAEQVSCG